jgi:hypothetical protein
MAGMGSETNTQFPPRQDCASRLVNSMTSMMTVWWLLPSISKLHCPVKSQDQNEVEKIKAQARMDRR